MRSRRPRRPAPARHTFRQEGYKPSPRFSSSFFPLSASGPFRRPDDKSRTPDRFGMAVRRNAVNEQFDAGRAQPVRRWPDQSISRSILELRRQGWVMTDFVEFPEPVYVAAGKVFANFQAADSSYTPENALAMMWFAQLAYEVDDTGGNANAAKIARIAEQFQFEKVTPFRRHAVALTRSFDTTGVVG